MRLCYAMANQVSPTKPVLTKDFVAREWQGTPGTRIRQASRAPQCGTASGFTRHSCQPIHTTWRSTGCRMERRCSSPRGSSLASRPTPSSHARRLVPLRPRPARLHHRGLRCKSQAPAAPPTSPCHAKHAGDPGECAQRRAPHQVDDGCRARRGHAREPRIRAGAERPLPTPSGGMFVVWRSPLVQMHFDPLTRRREFILHRYFQEELDKAMDSSRTANNVPNHTISNNMAEAAGLIELFLDTVQSEDPKYSVLHSATVCPQRGMRACRQGQAYVPMAANENELALEPERLTEFVGKLVAGAGMRAQVTNCVLLFDATRAAWSRTTPSATPFATGPAQSPPSSLPWPPPPPEKAAPRATGTGPDTAAGSLPGLAAGTGPSRASPDP